METHSQNISISETTILDTAMPEPAYGPEYSTADEAITPIQNAIAIIHMEIVLQATQQNNTENAIYMNLNRKTKKITETWYNGRTTQYNTMKGNYPNAFTEAYCWQSGKMERNSAHGNYKTMQLWQYMNYAEQTIDGVWCWNVNNCCKISRTPKTLPMRLKRKRKNDAPQAYTQKQN